MTTKLQRFDHTRGHMVPTKAGLEAMGRGSRESQEAIRQRIIMARLAKEYPNKK